MATSGGVADGGGKARGSFSNVPLTFDTQTQTQTKTQTQKQRPKPINRDPNPETKTQTHLTPDQRCWHGTIAVVVM